MTGLSRFKARNHPQQIAKRTPSLFGEDGETELTDDRATDPGWFHEYLQPRFRFTLDVAATANNAKLDRYLTAADDGLARSWADERVFCNPPYSAIEAWVRKAWAEHETSPLIVMLLPANRTEQGWWQRQVEPFRDYRYRGETLRVEFMAGRMRFIQPGRERIEANERPPFGCCLLIWERRKSSAFDDDGFSVGFDVGRAHAEHEITSATAAVVRLAENMSYNHEHDRYGCPLCRVVAALRDARNKMLPDGETQ